MATTSKNGKKACGTNGSKVSKAKLKPSPTKKPKASQAKLTKEKPSKPTKPASEPVEKNEAVMRRVEIVANGAVIATFEDMMRHVSNEFADWFNEWFGNDIEARIVDSELDSAPTDENAVSCESVERNSIASHETEFAELKKDPRFTFHGMVAPGSEMTFKDVDFVALAGQEDGEVFRFSSDDERGPREQLGSELRRVAESYLKLATSVDSQEDPSTNKPLSEIALRVLRNVGVHEDEFATDETLLKDIFDNLGIHAIDTIVATVNDELAAGNYSFRIVQDYGACFHRVETLHLTGRNCRKPYQVPQNLITVEQMCGRA